MSMGTPWETSTPASVSRKNKTSVITMSGDELESLDKTKFKIVTCNADGGQFLNHHTYYFGDDGSTVVDLTELEEHTHTGTTDGGDMTAVRQQTPEFIELSLLRSTDLVKESWIQTVTGTGSIENVAAAGTTSPYIRLRPNGTSGSGATVQYPFPINVDFSERSIFVSISQFETATNLAFHVGVNADDVTAADSNTIKYQAEVCTTTNSNWWLRTANGSANSGSDTGVAINTSVQSVKMIHEPDAGTPYVRIEVDASNSFMKTTNIPLTGSSTGNNIIKFSQKNSTGADRPCRVRGAYIAFSTASSWGYGGIN